MEIHIRTLAFVLLSLLGSVSLPFLVHSLPEGSAANAGVQSLPTPTPVPLRGLSPQTQNLAHQLQPPAPPSTSEVPTSSAAASTTATVHTNGANLNIRSGPGLDQAVIGSAPLGMALTVTGISVDRQWLQIALPGIRRRGWIFKGLTTLDGDLITLPTISEEE